MTATADVKPLRPRQRLGAWFHDLHPGYRLPLRWFLIGTMTTIAFHSSILSLVETTRGGGLGAFVWTVAIVGVLVAVSVSRWPRTELPIHDRQTDIIVGTMGLGLALLIHGVLLARYSYYFHLLRLDLVAMWFFVLSSSIVLFGLRPVGRYAWVWAMMLLLTFPLPYYVAVASLGGGRVAAGAATLLVSGVGAGIALGRTFRRGLAGSVVSWAFGGLILLVMTVYFFDSSLLAFQMIPAVLTTCVVGGGFYWHARRGVPKRLLDRKVEPLAARQVWAGVPVVVAVGIALALVNIPSTLGTTPLSTVEYPVDLRRPLSAPPGWHVVRTQQYPGVSRLYGRDSVLTRQEMAADVGDPRYDKKSRPRTLMVDTIFISRGFAERVYPTRVLYDISSARISNQYPVDLGNGVTGQLLSGVDDVKRFGWNLLQFAWGHDGHAEHIAIWAVDNHDPDAPFPEPSIMWQATFARLFTVLLRGNAAVTDKAPSFKDRELLTGFGTALVVAQLQRGGNS
ncbi:hypothetical protein [Mycolicibacterium sp.]|uniref:hypothetical protein n=1 Tax=Mycolicibacterium sp. TaxID=2320850 RepID=UPI001A337413|nr:hypothetical protein [Mycolicibacterium sp.]MBJ7340480.1 hypothetical protein [Mycolicibacterium sp.]